MSFDDDDRPWEYHSPFLDSIRAIPARFVSETKTAEPESPAAPATEPPPEEKKSAPEEAEEMAEDRPSTGGAKPPEEGRCRECNLWRRLNRLKLCYPCWAILWLKDECKKRGFEWNVGDPHPDFCGCEGLGEHPERDNGAWRGN